MQRLVEELCRHLCRACARGLCRGDAATALLAFMRQASDDVTVLAKARASGSSA
jgi:hypothetical protein